MATARTMPVADGTETYAAAVVLAGASPSTAVFKRAPVSSAGMWPGQNLPIGNTIMTLALMRSGVLTSTAADATTLLLPRLVDIADIGSYVFTPNTPNNLVFALQRIGLGGLFVNAAVGVNITWNNLDTATLPQEHAVVMLRLVAVDRWVAG